MPASRKPFHKYPVHIPEEPEKYMPSVFFDVPFDNLILKAEIRPLVKDVGYYTVSLDGIFLGHIHKVGMLWTDFVGNNTELYQIIGELIGEHLKK